MSKGRRRKGFLLAALLASGTTGSALAWGQAEHAVQGEATLRLYADQLPAELSAPETREDYVYANYSPDGYLFHGPDYLHLDRQFATLLLNRARDARGIALAYGWASHQEQDAAGHGRYITESGLSHLQKEVSVGARVRYQGASWERDVVKGMRAVFDVEQVHQASVDYQARYGAGYPVVTRRHARLTGYGYAAYLTAQKAILWGLYHGRLRWKSGLYPRRDWQGPFEESIALTRDWARDFRAFSSALPEALRSGLFDRFLTAALTPEVAAPRPLELRPDPAETAHRVRRAVEELQEEAGGVRNGVLISGRHLARQVYPASHALVRDDQFVRLGARLATSSAVRMEERTDGSFFVVEPVIEDEIALARDLAALLAERKDPASSEIFADGAPRGERAEFFDELATATADALREIDGR